MGTHNGGHGSSPWSSPSGSRPLHPLADVSLVCRSHMLSACGGGGGGGGGVE